MFDSDARGTVGVPFDISDVVGLPVHGRERSVGVGRGDLVDAAAVVVLERIKTKGIEDLNFVFALELNAAVAAILALLDGHVGSAEFDVETEVGELAFGSDVALGDAEDAFL